jgi:hypothetical protein
MFIVTKSYQKKFHHCHFNVIHTHKIAFCIHFTTFTCCLCLTCSSVCNYSHIFLCFYCYTVVCPVCIKHHPCTWLGISLFDSKHFYNFIILHNVLLLTRFVSYLLFCVWIYGMLNKISISTSKRKFGKKEEWQEDGKCAKQGMPQFVIISRYC